MDSIETAVQGIKNGDCQLFEVIIEAYQQQLFHYCYHMIGNIHEAEDAVQETLFKVFQNINKYHQALSFSAWMYKIAYNHCINFLRRKRLIRFLPFLEESGMGQTEMESSFEESEFSATLQKCLMKLSAQDRSLLILRILEAKSYEELSQTLNIKPATLRKKYERAVKTLKRDLIVEKGGHSHEEYAIDR